VPEFSIFHVFVNLAFLGNKVSSGTVISSIQVALSADAGGKVGAKPVEPDGEVGAGGNTCVGKGGGVDVGESVAVGEGVSNATSVSSADMVIATSVMTACGSMVGVGSTRGPQDTLNAVSKSRR